MIGCMDCNNYYFEDHGVWYRDGCELLGERFEAADGMEHTAKNCKHFKERRDKMTDVYMREKKGHSLILHLVFGAFVLWIPAIYFTISKNHYWHL